LLQIGSGILAVNDGPFYEWNRYKTQVLTGVKAVLDSYPRLEGLPLTPYYLELRYIDVFDEALLSTPDLLSFLSAGTSLQIMAPPFILDDSRFKGPIQARFALQTDPRGWSASKFVVDMGSSSNPESSRPSFQLQTKVVTEAPAVPPLGGSFRQRIEEWLEFAHGLTRPFFRSFINKDLMTKFETVSK
jgi:uncharacterized protein (TIGR04255 family)